MAAATPATPAARTAMPIDGVTDAETLDHVRPAVREILQASEAFRALPEDEQRTLAREMVKVSSYMANPDGMAKRALDAQSSPSAQGTGPVARAQADDATEQLRKRLAKDPGFAGEDFEAGAVQAGTQAFGELVQTVDFPGFVSGLIRGVFEAIVDSSIDQMRAYGELLANVSKSVDEFARDNISENNARDWLTDRFPDALALEEEGFSSAFAEGETAGETAPEPSPRLAVREDAPEGALEIIRDYFGLKDEPDLSEPTSEAELVRRAQLEIARGRQQLLASMVVLGINRIVVTDGLINAKVIFDMKARDTATRAQKASMHDRKQTTTSAGMSASYSSWFSPYKASAYANTSKQHVATVQTSVDETSDSRAEIKARLSGEVRVNFKSDHFPMESLATPEMLAAIQGNAQPTGPQVAGA